MDVLLREKMPENTAVSQLQIQKVLCPTPLQEFLTFTLQSLNKPLFHLPIQKSCRN